MVVSAGGACTSGRGAASSFGAGGEGQTGCAGNACTVNDTFSRRFSLGASAPLPVQHYPAAPTGLGRRRLKLLRRPRRRPRKMSANAAAAAIGCSPRRLCCYWLLGGLDYPSNPPVGAAGPGPSPRCRQRFGWAAGTVAGGGCRLRGRSVPRL